MRVEVEVQLSDGTAVRGECTAPPGAWGRPIDDALHRAKITDCLDVRFDATRRARAFLERIEALSSDEVAALAALLA